MAIIEEQAKKIAIPRIEVREKLHGHTKIELRSVRTGKVERIEHDNFFTDGIASYMRYFGTFNCTPFANSTVRGRQIWQTLLGGVLLFDTVLPTSPAAKYMPAGVGMTANGSYGVSNSGTPTELGSYNGIESVVGSDSISLVYDWGTSQGNGTIASVALTTQDGGYIGYGNKSGNHGTLRSLMNLQTYQYLAPSTNIAMGYALTSGAFLYYNNDFYFPVIGSNYCFASGSTSVSFYRKCIQSSSIDIFGKAPFADNTFDETISINLPSALSTNYRVSPCGASKPSTFMLLPNNAISNNGNMIVYFVDVVAKTVTTKTITNTTGATWVNVGIYCQMLDENHLIFAKSGSISSQYIVNVNDNTYEALTVPQYSSNDFSDGRITDDLLILVGSGFRLYDNVNKTMYPTNGYMGFSGLMSQQYYSMRTHYNQSEDCLACGIINNRNLFLCHNPLRLMTINNLDDTVTKDATKTMKVTYTITRSA